MKKSKNLKEIPPIKALEGIYRRTMCFNDEIMLCYFNLKKGSEIPSHKHKENQVGYVIRGKMKFFTEDEDFIVEKGDCYLFQSNESHGAKILEDTEVIDIFNPSRVDYL
ncbi:MAG: cupin domain-containing protein [Promethearchaeota archaeon]|nr:MAG: cupin domain-containing protein [Candidatus Lokiarchaeota archaeon]